MEILEVVYVSVGRTVVIHSQEHVVSTYCCSCCTRNAAVCERACFKRNEALTKKRNSQRSNCGSYCSLYTKNFKKKKRWSKNVPGVVFRWSICAHRQLCALRQQICSSGRLFSMGECVRSPTNTHLCRAVTLFLRFALKLCPRTTPILMVAVLKLDFSHLTF